MFLSTACFLLYIYEKCFWCTTTYNTQAHVSKSFIHFGRFWKYLVFIFSVFNNEHDWLKLPPPVCFYGKQEEGTYRWIIFFLKGVENADRKWLCGGKLLSNSISPRMNVLRYESKFEMTRAEMKTEQFKGEELTYRRAVGFYGVLQ